MLIDTTRLMYQTFQSCRHAAPDTGLLLDALSAALDVVRQRRALIIALPDGPPDTYPERLVEIVSPPGIVPDALGSLSPASDPLFELVCAGTRDMIRLWSGGSTYAVRSVGYALHVVPDLLRKPGDFNRKLFIFSFRVAGSHWHELSPELQRALSAAVGYDVDKATKLMEQEDYPVRMWRQPRSSGFSGRATPAGQAVRELTVNVEFKDTGLRLGVIEALFEKDHFEEEREDLVQAVQDIDAADEYSAAVSKRLKTWELSAAQLAEVTAIDIDGGNEVYLFHALDLDAGWAGCDRDEFVVSSLEDVRHLPNLASFSIVALLREDLDLEPLLSVPALNKVFLDMHVANAGQRAVLTELKARGVDVRPAHLVP